jgi:hypothetical protein
MQVGEVIKWNNFKFPQFGGKPKSRWFICLGNSNVFIDPKLCYLISTTTTKRTGHPSLLLPQKTYPFFCQDCCVFFNEPIYSPLEQDISQNSDISSKGRLEESDLRVLYSGLLRSSTHQKIVMKDIHSSFNLSGITGLRRP